MTRRTQFCGTICLLAAAIVSIQAWSLSAQDNGQSSNSGGGRSADHVQGGLSTGFPGGGGPPGSNKRPGRAGQPAGSMGGGGGSMMSQMMGRGGGGFGGMAGMMMGGPAGPVRAKTVTRTFQEVIQEPVPAEELEEHEAFQNAMQALKTAKDDTEKKKASDTVREHLAKQLDRDLVQREQELAEVEERVKQLKQQLAKRKASKDDIVSLRLKTIINNAEGLGFPGDDVSQETNSFPGASNRGSGMLPGALNFFGGNPETRD